MSATRLADLAMATDPGLPEFFLERLSVLVARQDAVVVPAARVTLGVAAFSIFLDCLDFGLGDEAHANMARAWAGAGPTTRPAA